MNTQDQVNEKSIAIVIKGGKISGKVLAKAIMLLLKQGKKQIDKANAPKIGKGKQSVKDLVKHGAGVTNIEITDANIGSYIINVIRLVYAFNPGLRPAAHSNCKDLGVPR